MGVSMEEHSEPLLPQDPTRNVSSDVEQRAVTEKSSSSPKWFEKKTFLYASALWFAGTLLLFMAALLMHIRPREHRAAGTIYSPVEDRVRYQTVVFDPSLGKSSIYAEGPSPAVDKAWEDLYDFGLSWITAAEAAHLPNATSRLPSMPSRYVTGLDVFHQLRCLNLIRKKLNPEYYANDTQVRVDHCLDQLRQSLMCNADTATIPWSWSKSQERTMPSTRTTHTCKDFEAIRSWARGRQVLGEFDKYTYLEGSPVSD